MRAIVQGFTGFVSGLLILSLATHVRSEDTTQSSQVDSFEIARKHLYFGGTYLSSKRFEDAEDQLHKAWGYLPDEKQTLKHRAQCARLLGRLYHDLDRYDEAVPWYQTAVALSPQSPSNKKAYRALTRIYIYQRKLPEAIQTFEKLLMYPSKVETQVGYFHSLVALCIEEKSYEKALLYAERWRELAPEDPEVPNLMAELYLLSGGEGEAVAKMEEVLAMNPGDFDTLERLAEIYQSRGNFPKAFEAYQRLHAQDSDNFLYLEHLLTLGKQLAQPGSFQIQILEKMHRLQPGNLAVLESLAKETKAVLWIAKVLQLDPENGRFLYLMGEHYYHQWEKSQAPTDSSNAIEWYRKALVDSQWVEIAQHMIGTIHPPMTFEDSLRATFFDSSKIQNRIVIDQDGKK